MSDVCMRGNVYEYVSIRVAFFTCGRGETPDKKKRKDSESWKENFILMEEHIFCYLLFAFIWDGLIVSIQERIYSQIKKKDYCLNFEKYDNMENVIAVEVRQHEVQGHNWVKRIKSCNCNVCIWRKNICTNKNSSMSVCNQRYQLLWKIYSSQPDQVITEEMKVKCLCKGV